jgi:hypothetical protein
MLTACLARGAGRWNSDPCLIDHDATAECRLFAPNHHNNDGGSESVEASSVHPVWSAFVIDGRR